MFKIILMLTNYFHDLSVALLASNVMVVWFVGRHLADHPVRDEVMTQLYRRLSRVTIWTLIFVVVAGAVRAWFFMEFEWNPAVGKGQTSALVVKHVLMTFLTVAGIFAHRRYRREFGV